MIMLYRKSYEDIKQWYYNSEKALLVDGARQVGKTTLIRNFFNDNNNISFFFKTILSKVLSIISIKLVLVKGGIELIINFF